MTKPSGEFLTQLAAIIAELERNEHIRREFNEQMESYRLCLNLQKSIELKASYDTKESLQIDR